MNNSEQRRNRSNNAFNVIQLVAAFLAYFWHLGPMGQRPQVMFLVVTVIERHQVVKTAVITDGVSVVVFRQRAVVFVVVLDVDERQREKERRQVTQQEPFPGERQKQDEREEVAHPIKLDLPQFPFPSG